MKRILPVLYLISCAKIILSAPYIFSQSLSLLALGSEAVDIDGSN